ncbi:MAG TPA: NUDIX hydrolase [Cyclobacteriaceae bacterium]|jgi:8-oxo-dGTP pyrophosphatase MutT (NUDIX family)
MNPWKILSSEEIYENPWIRVTEYKVINPGGGNGTYGKVHFKNRAVGVVPVDSDGNTWLVGQYRFTLSEYSWEIPEGGAPEGEELLACAQRELLEEAGLTARSWKLLSKIHTSNSVTDETGWIYLATNITEGVNNPEESEADLKVKKLPLSEAVKMVLDGKITDAVSMAGLLLAERFLTGETFLP